MADIDLIPHDYRIWIGQQSMLRRYATGFVALNAMMILIGGGLHYLEGQAQGELLRVKSENALTQQQQAQLQQLTDQQIEYERQLSLLYGLRAGAAIDDIFAIIDRTLVVGELWFLDWSFRRAGVVVNGEPRGIETGYFIIVSEDGDALADQGLEVQTHMTIHGQARNHQSLSKFVRALFEEPDIRDVNVQKTSQTGYANRRVVDFAMTVVLNSALKRS